jgi:undecaprenyl-diphosphatase
VDTAPATPARGRGVRVAVVAVVVCAVVVAVLAAGVRAHFGPQLRLDGAVSRALYVGDARPRWLGVLLQVLTAPGLTVVRTVVYLPVVVRLAVRRAWLTAAWVVAAVLLVGPLTTLVKDSVGRLRPQFAGGGARLSDFSYPSGHSSGIATLVTVALVLAWPRLSRRARRGWLAAGLALAALVAATRVLLGVHYLSDVVGGLALGTGFTLLVALGFGALAGGRAALPAREPLAAAADSA